jgi:hypothetical protein
MQRTITTADVPVPSTHTPRSGAGAAGLRQRVLTELRAIAARVAALEHLLDIPSTPTAHRIPPRQSRGHRRAQRRGDASTSARRTARPAIRSGAPPCERHRFGNPSAPCSCGTAGQS